jgi:hypothetical protein
MQGAHLAQAPIICKKSLKITVKFLEFEQHL